MSRMRSTRQLAVVAAALALSLTACGASTNASGVDAPSGPWSFKDGSGKVVKTGKTPTRIAEAGTHDELLAEGGRYAAMWAVQTGQA